MAEQSIYTDPGNFGLIEISYLVREAAANDLTTYITGLFAYLVVAYFVGRDLSRFQLYTVSGLYLVYMLFNLRAMHFQLLQMQELSEILAPADSPPAGADLFVGLLLIGLLISLVFMYEVRVRSKRDEST